MDALSQIRSIIESATMPQPKASGASPSTGSIGSKPEVILTGPGVEEVQKAINAVSTNQAKHPQNSGGKSSSSTSNKLKEEEETSNGDNESGDDESLVEDSAEFTKTTEDSEEILDEQEELVTEGKPACKDKEEYSNKKKFPNFMKKGKNDSYDEDEEDSDNDEDDDKEDKKKSKKDKKDIEEAVNAAIKQHMDALFNNEATLSEDFKLKAKTIFEGALLERENALRQEISEEFEVAIKEGLAENKTELAEQLDAYLSYVVSEWMEANKLELEGGLKLEIAESFLTDLRGVFLSHNIEVPAAKVDVLDQLSKKNQEVEARLNEQVNKNVELNKQIQEFKKGQVLAQVTADSKMTTSDSEKFGKLCEGISFENEETFAKKVQIIKENYFANTSTSSNKKSTVKQVTTVPVEKTAELVLEDTGDGSVSEEEENLSPLMEHYVKAISRTAPRK